MKPLITAHTGCMKTPYNSLEAIRAGAEYAVFAVEFDVRFKEDGTPVLSHDETKPNKSYVTLDEAFALVASYKNLKVNVDLKELTNLKEVQASAEKHGLLNRIFYTGVSLADVETIKKDTPEIAFQLNWGLNRKTIKNIEYIDETLLQMQKSGAEGINLNFRWLTPYIRNRCTDLKLSVAVWTVNTPRAKKKVLALSPDIITTKKPPLFE